MKLSDLYAVEGDPLKGGLHIKQVVDVLALNRRAFLAGLERPLVVLAFGTTLEEAQAAERDLKRDRRDAAAERELPGNLTAED